MIAAHTAGMAHSAIAAGMIQKSRRVIAVSPRAAFVFATYAMRE